MKLWHSFIKEFKLAYRGFYFYVEIFMAIALLVILMFVIPEEFESKKTEYVHLDLPEEVEKAYIKEIEEEDIDNKGEIKEIKVGDKVVKAKLYETEDSKIYLIDNKEDLVILADKKQNIGAVIKMEDDEFKYEYYLQGYESQRLKNLYLIFHNEDMDALKTVFEQQDVRPLSTNYDELTDRENVIPSFLTFNGSLMGLFIIAAYVFLDKKEGVIKAYAVTPSPVWQYLMSKAGIILITSVFSSLLIVIPVMKSEPNYLLLVIFLVTTGFFASSLGLLISSFYENIMQAFGAIYLVMMAMIIPNIAYFIPSWDPIWIRILPTYPMLQGFKEIILKNGDASYVITTSLGFLAVGLLLFLIANKRFKRTLSV